MTFEQLEHEYARLFRENARLRAALGEIVNKADCDGSGEPLSVEEAKVVAREALANEHD